MSGVKKDQFPESGIAPGKRSQFWLNKCSPCWYAAKKIPKSIPAGDTDFDAEDDDDALDVDDLEEDEITYNLKKYSRRGGNRGVDHSIFGCTKM